MLRSFILLVSISFTLLAQEVNLATESTIELPTKSNIPSNITLEWLEKKPRTITKDFFIHQFLQQEITSDEALQALGQAKYVNNKLFIEFAKKFNDPDTSYVASCLQMPTDKLIEQNSDCIEIGLSVYDATKLDYEHRESLIDKLSTTNKSLVSILKILNSPIPFTKLISSPKEIFFKIFNNCGGKYREEFFNYSLPQSTINRLKDDPRFEATIHRIALNKKLFNMQKGLIQIDPTEYSFTTTFFLALNALNHKQHANALIYLENAYKKAYYSKHKDQIRFWQYKISKEERYKQDLLQSSDINIYTLYAHELNNSIPNNIFFDVDQEKNNFLKEFNSHDPFKYVQLIKDTKKQVSVEQYLEYKELFTSEDTLPHLVYVTNKYENYSNKYYITPYEQTFFKDMNAQQKALMYAIARQESNFIPTSISSAYALGIMQIMPFLGHEIAKKQDISFQTIDLLNIKTNIEFAKIHLQDLKSRLKHPLFIAYAYNAGEGFINRQVFSNQYFSDNVYEPFLSMELIPYGQTREYGKKVLANYYIYLNHLSNKKVKLSTMLEKLLLPYPEQHDLIQ